MRHSNSGRKLSRTPAHRKALLQNLAKALLIHGKIRTTEIKAKELRRVVEPLITLAKRNDLHARRQAYRVLNDHALVKRLFDEIGPVFAGVPGIGCSGGKSGSAAKSGGGAGNLHRIYGFIAWRDWTTGWAGDELGGRTGDLSGGGGTGRNRVITDVAIKKTASGTRP